MVNMELDEIAEEAKVIAVIKDGDRKEYCGGEEFSLVLNGWRNMLVGSYEMPAFGVSLNADTRAAMKKGVWVEYCFGEVLTHNEMNFSKLLVEVVPQFKGFNIIRYNSGAGYSGRCFYINLDEGDMSDFYDLLVNL